MPESSEHIRHLAGLFLTQTAPGRIESGACGAGDDAAVPGASPMRSAQQHRRVPSRPIVECVMVGHLPVRAGLWLTQYADEVARQEGPTGLVRLDPDQAVFEILRGDGEVARASNAGSLSGAMATVAGAVMRWIIRPEAGSGVDSILDASPDLITILSGADEIAIVAAYRAIKDLCEQAARRGERPPRIELAILGASQDQARRAADKIVRTASESLGVDVRLRRSVQAMGPLGSTLHFRFPADSEHALVDVLEVIRSSSRALTSLVAGTIAPQAGSETVQPSGAVHAPPSREEEEVHMHERSHAYESDHRGDTAEMSTASPSRLATPIGGGWAPDPQPALSQRSHEQAAAPVDESSEVRLPPKPTVHVEPKRMIPTPKPRSAPPARALASWIKGLALLPVRCPDAQSIEIAADTHGRLHLIAWENDFRRLAHVEAWVCKHREILRMACAEHTIATGEESTMHVFTSEPATVSDLHGGAIRLHVLAPVEVEGHAGWFSAPLNQ